MLSNHHPRLIAIARLFRPGCCLAVAGWLCIGAFVRQGHADVPVPARVLNPLTVEEAWNVVRLATANVERLLEEKRIDEVTPQISLCSPSLRLIGRNSSPAMTPAEWNDRLASSFRSINLIARDALSGNLDGARAVFRALQATLDELARGVDRKVIDGEVYHCLNHPDVVAFQPGGRCDKCQSPLVVRRIPYSFVYVSPKEPHLKMTASVVDAAPAGEARRVILRLQDQAGHPLAPSDCIISHTRVVHAFAVDESLKVLQFLDVSPGEAAGDYATSYASPDGAAYRVWAAVIPAVTGLEEFPRVDLPGTKGSAPSGDGVDTLSASVAGLRFQLAPLIGGSAQMGSGAGQLQILQLDINDDRGQPVTTLEPFLNVFAQLVAIYDDRETVALFHPTGGDILREDVRGGPHLTFKVFWPKAGFVRLFCVVKEGGRTVVAPFALTISKPTS